jgi:uncharacterized membrane protein YdbT with pleckstrin-like domain
MKRIEGFSLKKIKAKKEFIFPAFLIERERIIFKTHPHWLYVLVPELALFLIGIFIFAFLPSYFPKEIFPLEVLLTILFFALFSSMLIIFLNWLCINYYLTNFRLIEERGIIGKRIMSIWLDKVQDITCSFGILGRIFGFGNLEIQSAGTEGKIVFDFLPNPQKLKEEIEKAILEFKK